MEFKQADDGATVRMQAGRREDLECVAEALYRHAWEQAEEDHRGTQQEGALVKAPTLLGPNEMLADLRQRLEQVELRLDKEKAWTWDMDMDRLQLARPIRLFLSYAPEDEQFCHQMERHLGALRRQGVIESWHIGKVQAGQMRSAEVQQALDAADVAVVLVSSDLVGADAPFAELQRALARHAAGEARVITVRLRPVDLVGTPLEHLHALPEGGKPVTRWENQDEAFVSVASGIRRVVLGMVGPSGRPALPVGLLV